MTLHTRGRGEIDQTHLDSARVAREIEQAQLQSVRCVHGYIDHPDLHPSKLAGVVGCPELNTAHAAEHDIGEGCLHNAVAFHGQVGGCRSLPPAGGLFGDVEHGGDLRTADSRSVVVERSELDAFGFSVDYGQETGDLCAAQAPFDVAAQEIELQAGEMAVAGDETGTQNGGIGR